MHLEPERVLKRRGIVLSKRASVAGDTDFFINNHHEKHLKLEKMSKIAIFCFDFLGGIKIQIDVC